MLFEAFFLLPLTPFIVSSISDIGSKIAHAMSMNTTPYPIHDKEIIYRGDGATLYKIYDTLTSRPDIEGLDLDFVWAGCVPPEEPWAFEFRDGDRFPALKKLSLSKYDFEGRTLSRGTWRNRKWGMEWAKFQAQYLWHNLPFGQTFHNNDWWSPKESSLMQWKRAMDFSKIHTLALAQSDTLFYTEMARSLPSLRHLSITLGTRGSRVMPEALDFLRAVLPLESLSVRINGPFRNFDNGTVADRAPFPFDLILERHGPTLRSLSLTQSELHTPGLHRPMLSIEDIDALGSAAPNISFLDLDIERNGSWPYDTFQALASLPQLTSLKLNLEIGADLHNRDHGEYYFNPEGLDCSGPLREPRMSISVAEELSQWFDEKKVGYRLERLEFVVGDWQEKPYSGPLYLPSWEEGRSRKFICDLRRESGRRCEIRGDRKAWYYDRTKEELLA